MELNEVYEYKLCTLRNSHLRKIIIRGKKRIRTLDECNKIIEDLRDPNKLSYLHYKDIQIIIVAVIDYQNDKIIDIR